MGSLAGEQGLQLWLLPQTQKEPWAGALLEPESEPELRRALEKVGPKWRSHSAHWQEDTCRVNEPHLPPGNLRGVGRGSRWGCVQRECWCHCREGGPGWGHFA